MLAGSATTLAELLEAWGDRPLVAHDWKALRRGAGDAEAAAREVRLANDTMVAAYLIDPARRRYPLDELLDQAGIEPVVEGGDDAARAAVVAVRVLSADQQEEIDRLELRPLLEEIELPLVDVLYRLELQGVKLDTYRLGETAARVSEEVDELEHQIFELAGEEFTIGSPQQLGGDPVREARAVAQAPRQDRLLNRRPRPACDPGGAPDRREGRTVA